MTPRTTVHQLESDFADAMQRMYAVGNNLARLRAELDREAVGAPGSAAAPDEPGHVSPNPAPVPPHGGGVTVAGSGASASGPGRMAPVPGSSATPTPAGAPHRPAAAVGTSRARPVPPSLPMPPHPPWSPVPWYQREGAVTRALAIAGAVVTLAGIAMLLVIAVQQGWFGPPARVAAGAVIAGALVATGVLGAARDRREGRPVGSAPVALVATGAAAAYLDVVAMTSGYGWLSPGVGLGVAGAVALAGLELARRWSSELLAVLLVLGAAVLAPVVADDWSDWPVTAFLAVLAIAGWWAAGPVTRPFLTLARILPVGLAQLATAAGSALFSAPTDLAAHLVVAVVIALATLATSAAAVRRDPRDVTSTVALGVVLVGLLLVTAAQSDPLRPGAFTVTTGLLLLAATTLSRRPLGPLAQHLTGTVAAAGAAAAVLAVTTGVPTRFVTTGLVALATAAAAVAGARRSRIALAVSAVLAVVALLAWVPDLFAMASQGSALEHDLAVAFVDSALVGGLVAVGWWALGAMRGLDPELRVAAGIGTWVVGLAASATLLVSLLTLVGEQAGDAGLGFTVGHALATVSWMLVAAWFLVRGLGRTRDADLVLRTGLLLSAVSVAKLFLYDLAALSGVVRSVAFIVTGLVLLATGSRYARAHDDRRAAEREETVPR
ncbi:MAG: DUF2339 domain-containing protein [Phycicoccus sp.]